MGVFRQVGQRQAGLWVQVLVLVWVQDEVQFAPLALVDSPLLAALAPHDFCRRDEIGHGSLKRVLGPLGHGQSVEGRPVLRLSDEGR